MNKKKQAKSLITNNRYWFIMAFSDDKDAMCSLNSGMHNLSVILANYFHSNPNGKILHKRITQLLQDQAATEAQESQKSSSKSDDS